MEAKETQTTNKLIVYKEAQTNTHCATLHSCTASQTDCIWETEYIVNQVYTDLKELLSYLIDSRIEEQFRSKKYKSLFKFGISDKETSTE